MANRYLRQFLQSQRSSHVFESGTISLSSAAAVTASDFTSLVASVAKTATGEYTITLADKWVGLLCVNATLEGGQAGTFAKVKSADPTSAKTVVINTSDATGPADVSAAAKLHVSIQLKNSTAR